MTTPTRPRRPADAPGLFAAVLGAVAAVCALAAVSAVFRHGIQPVRWIVDQLVLPAPANLAYAAFLGIVAAGVARRKRVAHRLLVGYLGLQVLGGLAVLSLFVLPANDGFVGRLLRVDRGDPVPDPDLALWLTAANLAVTVAAIVVLVRSRRQFEAAVRPGNLWASMLTLLGSALASVVVGYLLVAAFPGTLRASDRWLYATERVFGGVLRIDWTRDGYAPSWVNLVLGALGAVSLLGALLVLFRSQRTAAVLSPHDEQRVRALLDAHGERDSLGYFATRHDKAVVFSPSGKAAVTYRVVAGVSLASGDPIGDAEAWGPAVGEWLARARAYAWVPAVMGASEEGARAFARAGLKVLELGDEAIIDVCGFDLEGRDMRPVRQAVRRVERAGYTVRVRRHAELSSAEMAEVIRLADAWRDTAAERGFSMALSRLGDPADGRCVLVEALDADGRPRALLSLVPWGHHGLSLDLMRRDRDADNGLVEFMVSALVAAAPGLRVERLSLNFAVFRSAFEEGDRIGAGPVLRAWRSLLLFLSRWWQLESLYRSNTKYRPRWVPRFVCFAGKRELARIALATAIAEGFLVLPGRRGPMTGHPRIPAGARGTGSDAAPVVDHAPAQPPAAQLPEQVRVRLDKLARLRAEGVVAYPVGFERTDGCGDVAARYGTLPVDTRTDDRVSVAGRVMGVRDHGGLCFASVRDGCGDVQVLLTVKAGLDRWRAEVDLGDHVGIRGTAGTSATGEVTVFADDWTLTAKCLRPLPNKRQGLADPEARVRQRHLDLIIHPQARRMLHVRGEVVHALRSGLRERRFLEVETPMLQPVHGGANARPFVTHSNAYDLRLHLRIAPELYLKRLCVGGMERVYELGRCFRNEGVSVKHNPEFTMLEAYQAYADYTTMRVLVRELTLQACALALGGTVVTHAGAQCDLAAEWPVVPVHAAVSSALGEPVTPDTPAAALRALADRAGVAYDPRWAAAELLLELYERLVEKRTTTPTFYTDFPVEVSPLTRPHRDDPRLAERWDLVAFGTEIATAYSELIDPVEQRERLTAQSLRAAGHDPEAMQLDEDFLRALEYAMPPTGGLGLGVDRLVMLLTDSSIRETLPFPLVRPTAEAARTG